MPLIDNYILNEGSGPIIEKESSSKPYLEESAPYANSLEGSESIIREIFNELNSSISPLIDSAKKQIDSSNDNLMNSILIDGEKMDYLKGSDILTEIGIVEENIDEGGNSILSIISSFQDSIDDINTYFDTLKNNYEELQSKRKKLASYASEKSKLSLAPSNDAASTRITELNRLIANLQNEIEGYTKVTNITEKGKWYSNV